MQLTSKDGHMVVDFYPVKFHTGEIHNRLMLKVVTFCGKSQSKSYINKKDFQREVDSRTHGYGYQVTDESMIPQFYNSGMGMSCWIKKPSNLFFEIMNNPYVENLVAMGYDRADCETVAVAGVNKTFPLNIHGRVYQTQEEYDEALHDFINGQ